MESEKPPPIPAGIRGGGNIGQALFDDIVDGIACLGQGLFNFLNMAMAVGGDGDVYMDIGKAFR